ncbi:hypothetical protein GCM10010112_59600 [Actinoplanes lobatus]|uniref:Uncharacterized protein n=1 Tax=Actinoplanes lobatus TaxID=113568 RepID=A0A7W7HQV9_9ACTN|nr:hypothetical protein [Actinoplanes lobatus]MBB4755053.1 hypothetical protein [Actinoplanes lobatus]GGN82327.1 hypothetical protein GCM10010112_59600 [Actinoplanes lobatus]GIE40629.1 hypothetical protein Alo02nite_35270 [Actinoplanes lobatus]
MRVLVLSDHGGKQLGQTVAQLRSRLEKPTMHAIGAYPTQLLEAIDRYAVALDSQSCERIAALIRP